MITKFVNKMMKWYNPFTDFSQKRKYLNRFTMRVN